MKTYFFTSNYINATKTYILNIYKIVNNKPKYINLIESCVLFDEMECVISMLYKYKEIDENTYRGLLDALKDNTTMASANNTRIYDLALV